MDAYPTFDITSEALDHPLRVTVAPGAPGSPAVYVLDAMFLFHAAVGAARSLRAGAQVAGGAFPDLTIVGIGYVTEEPSAVTALRARDLTTPPAATALEGLPPLEFGGAERFLSAIVDDVIPAVEAAHDIDATHRALAGFSFSGLFTLYTLFNRPETFTGYIAGSPSLWWDGGVASEWEDAFAASNSDLPAVLFLSVGANEEVVGDSWKNEGFPLEMLRQLKQVTNTIALAERLSARNYPGLSHETVVFDGEFHLTAPPASLARGLLHLYE